MAGGSIGPFNFGPADRANFVHRGTNNGDLQLQSSASGQVNRGRLPSAARLADTNVAPDGVYNQFAFGVTAAAANSAYPSEHSLHPNLPNRIDADAYNHQFAKPSNSVSGYYGSNGGSRVFENGYTPFLYESPLYDRPHLSNDGSYSNDAAFGSGAFGYRSLTAVVARPAVYVFSHPLITPLASPNSAVADRASAVRKTVPTASVPDDVGRITDPVSGLPRS